MPFKEIQCYSCGETYTYSLFTGVAKVYCYGCGEVAYDGSNPNLPAVPRSQKAAGLKLVSKALPGCGMVAMPTDLIQVTKLEDYPNHAKITYPKFARPCPVTPQHGFVDSRVVKSAEELQKVMDETFAADPGGEVMLMTPIECDVNGILTDGMIAVGPGNDGATAGKDSVCLPLGMKLDSNHEAMKKAGITDAPYVEYVQKDKTTWITQLRNGPKLDNNLSPDCVPEEITVKKVIQTAGEDLLAWRDRCRGEIEEGTIVWHPGGNPIDHYSVHCRENKIPIVTTFEPKVGQVIKPIGVVVDLDPDEMIRGLAVADRAKMNSIKGGETSQMALALMALHSSGVLRGKHSFWLGYAAGVIMKLGYAAMRVEARHANGYKAKTGPNKPEGYAFYCNLPLSFCRSSLSRVTQVLLYGFGDPEASHSFGGKNWALCGAALAPMFNAVRKLVDNPTMKNASDIVTTMNIAVNQAHNGGWWLNKFISFAAYTSVPNGQTSYLASASNAIYQAYTLGKTVDVEKFKATVSKWPETRIKELRFRKMEIDVAPGTFIIRAKAATVPQPFNFSVPIKPEVLKTLIGKMGRIEVDGNRVVLITPDKEKLEIWKGVELEAVDRKSQVR